MGETWHNFVVGFCKVKFLCWHGEPNWLGWIVIVVGGLMTFMICWALIAYIFDH